MRDIHTPNYSHSSYMEHSIHPEKIKEALALGVPILEKYDFDAFAFRGMSGALLASPFALAMNKTLLLVRKNIADCHSKLYVEGDLGARHYIIIDDFIASGVTVRKILAEVEAAAPEAECLGVLEVANLFDAESAVTFTLGFSRRFGYLTEIIEQHRQLI